MKIEVSPQRERAWRELHTRPFVRFPAPAHVLHLAFLVGEQSEETDRADRTRLTEALGLTATHDTPKHSIHAGSRAGLGRLVLSWERHTEFTAFTLFLYELENPFRPFAFDFANLLPKGWLEGLGAAPLVATQMAVGRRDEMPDTLDGMTSLFDGRTVNGSKIMAGLGQAWTCYRVHDGGLGRVAVIVNEMSSQELGRTVQRLSSLEDYYHLTLLSSPLADALQPELVDAERRTVIEMDELRKAASIEQKRAVLDALLGLAAEVEHLRARVATRFGGSIAYFSLLEARFAELREAKIEHVLPLSRFVMRRLAPAAETYRRMGERLNSLSARVNCAAELLQTSVELNVQEQNIRLLESADHKARLQLRLQQSVETLSVVVISYYAIGLIGHFLEGMQGLGVRVDVKTTQGIALPIVLVAVWAIVHRIRRQLS